MNSKKIFLGILFFTVLLFFLGCKECEPDVFGIRMNLIMPINTSPAQDTFHIGDTLWVEAKFDKHVAVEGQTEQIFLEDFNFFTEFLISEISDTTENFLKEIEIVEEVGQVEELALITAFTYPLFFEESSADYHIKFGVIFKEIGRYYVGFNTSILLFENYEHSAMYTCEDERRVRVDILYDNESSDRTAFENIFLVTGVEYLVELTTYEGFRNGGAHTFIVEE